MHLFRLDEDALDNFDKLGIKLLKSKKLNVELTAFKAETINKFKELGSGTSDYVKEFELKLDERIHYYLMTSEMASPVYTLQRYFGFLMLILTSVFMLYFSEKCMNPELVVKSCRMIHMVSTGILGCSLAVTFGLAIKRWRNMSYVNRNKLI